MWDLLLVWCMFFCKRSLPGIDLADRYVETSCDVLHCLVALWDDAHSLGNGLGCDRVITGNHNDLREQQKWLLIGNNRLNLKIKEVCVESKQLTLIPADRHLPTASGTAARGGSIMDMRPTKQRLSVWKLTSSVSKAKPLGYWSSGSSRWQKPGVRGNVWFNAVYLSIFFVAFSTFWIHSTTLLPTVIVLKCFVSTIQ